MQRLMVLCFAGVLALAGVACGDDDGGDSAEALCGQLEDLGFEIPSDEQLDALVGAAPSEIRGDVRTLVDVTKEARDDPTALEPTDEQEEAAERFEAWSSENCDLPQIEGPPIDDLEELDIEGLDLEEFDLDDLEGIDLEELDAEQTDSEESQ